MGDETPDDIPPWGTPDSAPAAGSAGPPAYGTPPGAAPAGLLGAGTVIVAERGGFLAARGYDVFGEAGEHLASLTEETSTAGLFFGGAASSTFRLVDPGGFLLGVMHRPGSFGRFEFLVEDGHGGRAGRVQEEHSWSTPGFTLYTADGPTIAMRGTGWLVSSDWELVDAADESVVLGSVSTQYAGLGALLGGRAQFAVQLSPALRGSARLVAVLATCALNFVLDSKKRNS